MPETLSTPSPLQLRAELDKLVRQDLLGPAGGEREEIEERNVRGRYVVGMLAPKGQSVIPDDEDPLAVDGASDGQDGQADTAVVVTYGWQDLDLGHGFHQTPTAGSGGIHYTISEPACCDVLTRLLQLNHQRYEEEVKLGLHEKKTKRKRKTRKKAQTNKKKNDGQMSLF